MAYIITAVCLILILVSGYFLGDADMDDPLLDIVLQTVFGSFICMALLTMLAAIGYTIFFVVNKLLI